MITTRVHENCGLVGLVGVCLVGVPALAVAQTTSQQGVTANSADQLQQIVVTATRRQEDVQKVPISVSTLTQADLVAANIKNINDVAANTPGLQF
ncbi:MAG: hypothetical protein WAN26_10475, partial [Steroidobacteraceae bacterium]